MTCRECKKAEALIQRMIHLVQSHGAFSMAQELRKLVEEECEHCRKRLPLSE